MTPGQNAWRLTTLAIDLLAIDPVGLGGLSLRARVGPVRDRALEALDRLTKKPMRIHPMMPREALFGGLDLAATLSEGRMIETAGLLNEDVLPVLTMAERTLPNRAAELAAWLDHAGGPMVLLDEGAEMAECAPPALLERFAFHLSLDEIGRLEAIPPPLKVIDHEALKNVITPKGTLETLTRLALRLGIDSMRAPTFALRAARALAALENRDEIRQKDIETAAVLVLAPRATQLPTPPEPEPDDPSPKPKSEAESVTLPEDVLVEAIRPNLPDDLLERLTARKNRLAKGTGAGQVRRSNRRGRPLPSRAGRLGSGARVDLVATLRTAAPWQTLRNRGDGPVKVMPSDIRLRRFEEKSDRLIIFAVDASGSSAMARLAEAKGAVELLLAQSYANRDHVALVAFKGDNAEVLLPPTRSLVQTKRRLAALPGGGGTPLAAGLKAAGDLALQARAQGLTPTLALLTDGRANIALDGRANRSAAAEDSARMAGWLCAERLPALVFDTGNRPDRALQLLAAKMLADYLPLPRADARVLSQALRDGLDA